MIEDLWRFGADGWTSAGMCLDRMKKGNRHNRDRDALLKTRAL
jgi:hypothetical protein